MPATSCRAVHGAQRARGASGVTTPRSRRRGRPRGRGAPRRPTAGRPARVDRFRGPVGRAAQRSEQRADRTEHQAAVDRAGDRQACAMRRSSCREAEQRGASRRLVLQRRRVGLRAVHPVRRLAGPLLFALAVLGAVVVFLVRRTTWRAVRDSPLATAVAPARSGAGRWPPSPARRAFAGTAAVAVPIVALAGVIGLVSPSPTLSGASSKWPTRTRVDEPRDLVDHRGRPLAVPFVVISALMSPSSTAAGARALRRAWSGARARRFVVDRLPRGRPGIVLPSLTVIGVPLAIWLFVRWQFMPQAIRLEGIVGGRRWPQRRSSPDGWCVTLVRRDRR